MDLNPRDYRAWYGLGQTYELLHMPFYALNYFRRATQVRCAVWPCCAQGYYYYYYYTLFLPEARCVCRQAAVKAAKILPLDGLARSKQDPINRGHGAQYLYHPPPARAQGYTRRKAPHSCPPVQSAVGQQREGTVLNPLLCCAIQTPALRIKQPPEWISKFDYSNMM